MRILLYVATTMVLVFIFSSGVSIRNHLRFETHWKKRTETWNKYFAASQAFDAWRVARPFLFVGQSPYAKSLVWTMIETYEWLQAEDARWGFPDVIPRLYQLLNEQPPTFTPPRRLGGAFLFSFYLI